VSLIVIALANWATNSLNNTTIFSSASKLHYAASSVTDLAIESMRSNPLPSSTPTQGVATPLGNCWTPASGTISDATFDGNLVASWCSTVEYLSQPSTRVVTIYTCLESAAPNGAACQSKPLLTATVVFDDYPSNGGPQLQVQCNQAGLTCGEGITLQTWVWGKAINTPLSTIPQTAAFYNSTYSSVLSSGTAVYTSGTYQLYAQGSGFGAITFATTTPTLCTVSANGLVTLVGIGACNLTAAAAANTEYAASSPVAFTLTITPAMTNISVTSSVNPSLAGQAVTYTATVSVNSPGTGNPTGTMEFFDGGSPISSCTAQPLTGNSPDTATCTLSYSSSGSHAITAQFLATTGYATSTSSVITQTVNSLSYSGNTSAPITSTPLYYGINPGPTGSSVGSSTSTSNGLTLATGIHLTGLSFSVKNPSTTSTFIATVGYITGGSWFAALTATCAAVTQCTAPSGNVAIPAGYQINIKIYVSSGSQSYNGSWTVTYTQP
jgi:Bacterial Ig-like domain (group 3)